MFNSRHRLLVWWITLVIILAGSLIPSTHHVAWPDADNDANTAITLEICGPKGERLSYTITLDSSDSHSAHTTAHCLFCILPAAVDAIIDDSPAIQLSLFETIATITFPPYVHVPTQHDRWLPHRALAPPTAL